MSEVSTDTNDVFKNGLIRHMDRISSITISVKDEPVLFTFLEDGGFMIEGNTTESVAKGWMYWKIRRQLTRFASSPMQLPRWNSIAWVRKKPG